VSLPEEVLKKVRWLDISTRKLVNNLFAGEYHTAFKGAGMTFSEFREYVPGDDVRSIAWSLMARTGKLYIKKFDEERELTLMLAIDISGSGDFGTGQYLKGEMAAFIAAVLGFSAAKNNDRVGLLLFSDQVELYVPPKKGKGHVQRILSEILYFKPKSRGTNINAGLQHLMGILRKRSTIFLISDFLDKNYHVALRLLGNKHDVVAVTIQDPAEMELPNMGLVQLHDAETGELSVVDSGSPLFRKHYKEKVIEIQKQREQDLRKSQVDVVRIVSGDDFLDPLVAFFNSRHHHK
jgi:uncharacterized protein (DUF58 family)